MIIDRKSLSSWKRRSTENDRPARPRGKAYPSRKPRRSSAYWQARTHGTTANPTWRPPARELWASTLSIGKEDKVRRAESRYRNLVEQLPAVTFMASLDGGSNELYVSPQIEAMLGFSQREWLEDPILWYRQLHLDDRVRWHTEFAQTCALGKHFRAEYRFMARDGRVVWSSRRGPGSPRRPVAILSSSRASPLT